MTDIQPERDELSDLIHNIRIDASLMKDDDGRERVCQAADELAALRKQLDNGHADRLGHSRHADRDSRGGAG